MKYGVKNLRTNEIEVIYENLERAESYIRISVYYGNERKSLKTKKWSKRDFEIIKIFTYLPIMQPKASSKPGKMQRIEMKGFKC